MPNWFKDIQKFMADLQFVSVTDFAKTLKPRHKNGKMRK